MTERERAIVRMWHALGLTIEYKSKALKNHWIRMPNISRSGKDSPEEFLGGRFSDYVLRLKPHD